MDKKWDVFAKEKSGTLTQSNIYLFRIIRMIGDFAKHGVVLRRYHRTLSRVNNKFNLTGDPIKLKSLNVKLSFMYILFLTNIVNIFIIYTLI